jgi:monoterpene epsilon-lactone hydrolase
MSTSPEFRAFVAQLRATAMAPTLPEMRAAYDSIGEGFPAVEGVRRRSATLGGRPCLWAEPEHGAEEGAVLYLHGGGYAIGSIASHKHMGDGIAQRTRLPTAVLDYRLAPEHPFPAALDDAFAAYQELIVSVPPRRIVIVGDSAGGGLAVALMAKLIEAGLPRPSCSYLISPWVDLASDDMTFSKAATDPFCSQPIIKKMAAWYLEGVEPNASFSRPLEANLRSAPATLIQVGSNEVLLKDSLRLAQALGEADVDVELRIAADMIHVWPWLFLVIPEGAEALNQGCDFINKHVHSSSSSRM